MEKIFRIVDNHEAAEEQQQIDDDGLTYQQRFEAFMELMAPYYATAGGLQRVYRIDDLKQRSVCDDWGLRLQPLPKPQSDW